MLYIPVECIIHSNHSLTNLSLSSLLGTYAMLFMVFLPCSDIQPEVIVLSIDVPTIYLSAVPDAHKMPISKEH